MVQIILQRILCCILPIILQTAISVASKSYQTISTSASEHCQSSNEILTCHSYQAQHVLTSHNALQPGSQPLLKCHMKKHIQMGESVPNCCLRMKSKDEWCTDMYMHSSKQIHSPWEGILSWTATSTGLACNSMNANPSV